MSDQGYSVYESIVNATASELILFFVIMAVLAIPLYIVVLKGRKADRQHDREREAQFLEVIKENSAVMAELKEVLKSSGASTRAEIGRVHGRLEGIESKADKILLIVKGGQNRNE